MVRVGIKIYPNARYKSRGNVPACYHRRPPLVSLQLPRHRYLREEGVTGREAQAPDIRITSIYRGIIPFLIAPLVLIILLFLFPQLALWLPTVLYR